MSGRERSRNAKRGAWVVVLICLGVLAWRLASQPVPGGSRPAPRAAPGDTSERRATARSGTERARPEETPHGALARGPALFVPTARSAVDPVATTGRLEGTVRSRADGQPVAAAELVFLHDGVSRSVRSGPDGAFSFVPRVPGEHVLAVVTAQRFLPFSPELTESRVVFHATAGAVVRGVSIELSPVESIVVTVVDPRGRPVAGATVERLDDADGESRLVPLGDRATTDGAGEATVLAPEASVLEASKAGFASARVAVDLSARASGHVTIELGAPTVPARFVHELGGRVVDARATAIAGAHVIATPAPANAASPEARVLVAAGAETGPDGRFVLRSLAPERYDLVATDPDTGERARAPGVVAGTLDVELRLAASATLVGTVTDRSTGAPVTAFTVVVTERRSALELHDLARAAVLDASGNFEVRGLPPGPALVMVVASGRAPRGGLGVELSTERPARIDVELEPGRTLRGRVTEEGSRRPIADASVSAEGRIASAASIVPVVATTRTDVSGAFALDGLGYGLRALEVSARGHNTRIVQVLLGDADLPIVEIALSKVEPGETPRIELVGIGAVLAARGDVLVVGEVVPGGGAAEAGILPDDELLRVDAVPVATLGFAGAIGRIRGIEGSTVLLEVRRGGGEPRVIAVPRRRVLAR